MNISLLAPRANPGGALPRRSFACLKSLGILASPASARTGAYLRKLMLIGACILAATHAICAPSVTLAWDANPEPDIAGYELSYGGSPGNYSSVINVGNNTTTDITGLTQGQTYYFAVSAYNSEGLKSPPSPEISYTFVVIPTGDISLHYVDSEDPDGYRAEYAFDGDPNTFWHTEWRTNAPPPPHELQIDLGSMQNLRGFRYLPRQDIFTSGNIGQYEFYISADGVNWGTPVTSGSFPNTKELKEVVFAAKSGRYVRLRALTDASGGNVSNIAELSFLVENTPPPDVTNTAPSAIAQTLGTAEDTPLNISLTGSDAEGSALSYDVMTNPVNGMLTGTAPNLIYIPAANFSGSDSFTFRISDGALESVTATVSISITPVNDVPVAQGKSVTTSEDTPVAITLSGIDVENSPLTFPVVNGPANGTLTGTAPNLTYSPSADFSGSDSFTYRVNDGSANSATATVSITVTPVNDAPVAASKTITTTEDTPLAIVLSGSDKDLNTLTFSVVAGPANGTLTGTPPNLNYSPAKNFNGSDQLTFRVNDGTVNSQLATISIVITATNDAPVALASTQTAVEDTPLPIVLGGTDVEGANLSFTIVTGPTKGSLGGTPPNVTYTPASNSNGSDSFTFLVNDGTAKSPPATVSLTVTPVNDAPLANSISVEAPVGSARSIVLAGSDPDGNAITFAVVGNPTKGTLSGTAPNLTYQPNADATGSDQFTFKTSDGSLTSSLATVSINITPGTALLQNLAPVFTTDPISLNGNEDAPLSGQLAATDPNASDVLTFSKVSGPAWLAVSSAGVLSGTPQASDVGTNTFIVRVADNGGATDEAALSITIIATATFTNPGPTANRAPAFIGNPVFAGDASENASYYGQSLAGKAVDYDAGDSITYWKVSGPAWLIVTQNGQLSGTPPAGSAGTNSFVIRAADSAWATADTELRVNVSGLPLPWTTSDLGAGQIAGSVSYLSGTFTQTGSGALGNGSDKTRFTYQTLSGDGSIVAKVSLEQNSGPACYTGVMIRESMAPKARQVFLGLTNDASYRLMSRLKAGGKPSIKGFARDAGPDIWVRLTRNTAKKMVYAYKSADGINWTYLGATQIAMAKTCQIGLAVSSGSDSSQTIAKFSSVWVDP